MITSHCVHCALFSSYYTVSQKSTPTLSIATFKMINGF